MKRLLLFTALFALAVSVLGCGTPQVKGDPKYSTLVIEEFSLDGAAIQENVDVKAYANGLPPKFATMIKDYLVAMGVKPEMIVLAPSGKGGGKPNALVVKGNFVKVTGGSTVARMLVGFGAGRSAVEAKWDVVSPKGEKLGSYHENSATASGATAQVALESDSRHLARYVATMITKHLY